MLLSSSDLWDAVSERPLPVLDGPCKGLQAAGCLSNCEAPLAGIKGRENTNTHTHTHTHTEILEVSVMLTEPVCTHRLSKAFCPAQLT